ncbi:MAG TPA: hypothetical protein VNI61_03025 [Gemmatimonadales bacterium]|nr:hypothetical protein [Gemmatimonadales bacterium]
MTAALLAALAVAQQADTGRGGRPCRVVIDSVGRLGRQVEVAPGRYNYYAGGGVWAHCEGTGSSLTADSAAWYGAEQRFDLVGAVKIRDSLMHLDATTARYFTREERLDAHRNVVAVNRSTGTVLRGPNLTYLRAVAGVRDTSELFASSRPTIEYRAAGDSAEPYVVIGDRVRLRGNDRMWAGGSVTVDRSDIAARADSMSLDQTAGWGLLVGRPRVEGKGAQVYTLTGRRIELAIDSGTVRQVRALGAGEATGEDWRLVADTIHLVLRDRKLQQTFAWGDSIRPRAVSRRHTVEADSLALDTPDEVLTEMRAFGRALSTSRRDTTAAAELDWIAGDTLVARFVQVTDTAGDTNPELRELVARGSARALTHLYAHDRETGGAEEAGGRGGQAGPDINYSRGTSIAVLLKGDAIDRVVVTGRADGVHLEKLPPPPADTTRAATARPAARRPGP